MNISEITIGCNAVYCATEKQKEIVTVKGFTPEGKVLVKNSFGDVDSVAPDRITKVFKK